MFQYTGIRNARDGSSTGATPTLHQNTGVLVDVLGWAVNNVITTAQTLAGAGALLSVEGPNEPNNYAFYYNGQWVLANNSSWVPVGQYQSSLYAQVKASPTLKNYPVFAVTEGGAEVQKSVCNF